MSPHVPRILAPPPTREPLHAKLDVLLDDCALVTHRSAFGQTVLWLHVHKWLKFWLRTLVAKRRMWYTGFYAYH